MHSNLDVLGCRIGRLSARVMVLVALMSFAPPSAAEIIWNGDFSNGDFLQYHAEGLPNEVHFHFVPPYGRPIDYGGTHPSHIGNGELLSLVAKTERTVNGIHYPAGPTRGSSEYAAKFTVKSQAGGGVEPDDCDPAGNICDLRRSDIQQNRNSNVDYNALPMLTERWMSFSIHVPSNFTASGSGFGPVVWGSKSFGGGGAGWLGLLLSDTGWSWIHRPSQTDSLVPDWWHTMEYRHDRPSSAYWPQGLVDFPNDATSKASLANINKGRWTDFIIHFKSNHTLPVEQNDGFINIYMRAQGASGEGPWVHVLNILPMKDINLGGSDDRLYDRVIARYADQGFTSAFGLYMHKNRVWNHPHNMVVHFANKKVGTSNATFADMSPDGSTPTPTPIGVVPSPPRPPEDSRVD